MNKLDDDEQQQPQRSNNKQQQTQISQLNLDHGECGDDVGDFNEYIKCRYFGRVVLYWKKTAKSWKLKDALGMPRQSAIGISSCFSIQILLNFPIRLF